MTQGPAIRKSSPEPTWTLPISNSVRFSFVIPNGGLLSFRGKSGKDAVLRIAHPAIHRSSMKDCKVPHFVRNYNLWDVTAEASRTSLLPSPPADGSACVDSHTTL